MDTSYWITPASASARGGDVFFYRCPHRKDVPTELPPQNRSFLILSPHNPFSFPFASLKGPLQVRFLPRSKVIFVRARFASCRSRRFCSVSSSAFLGTARNFELYRCEFPKSDNRNVRYRKFLFSCARFSSRILAFGSCQQRAAFVLFPLFLEDKKEKKRRETRA